MKELAVVCRREVRRLGATVGQNLALENAQLLYFQIALGGLLLGLARRLVEPTNQAQVGSLMEQYHDKNIFLFWLKHED